MRLTSHIARWPQLPFGPDDTAAWLITTNAPAVIRAAIPTLGPDYRRDGETAIHASAQIEPGATIKGPAIIGAGCFIAASALLRGGVFLDEGCIIGPDVELKTPSCSAAQKPPTRTSSATGSSALTSTLKREASSPIPATSSTTR